jgi:hypothetical protein
MTWNFWEEDTYRLFRTLFKDSGLSPLLVPQENVYPGDIYIDVKTRERLPLLQVGQVNDLLPSPIVLPSVETWELREPSKFISDKISANIGLC